MGRGEMIIIGDVNGVFGDGRLELREEQAHGTRKKGNGEAQRVLAALALWGGGGWVGGGGADFGPAPGET